MFEETRLITTLFHISLAKTNCLNFTLDFALRNTDIKEEYPSFTIKMNVHAYGFLFQELPGEAMV